MIDYRDLLRRKRIEKGMSQTELAEKVGTTQPYIYQVESGRRTPSLALFFEICEMLDIKLFPDE